MAERHLINTVRHVTLNPVRARLVASTGDWSWSSARAHLSGVDGLAIKGAPVLERVGDFAGCLDQPIDDAAT